MRKRLFEDFFINKLYGYYLILYGNDHLFLARIIFIFSQKAICFLIFTRLIEPRIHSKTKLAVKKPAKAILDKGIVWSYVI